MIVRVLGGVRVSSVQGIEWTDLGGLVIDWSWS